MVQHFQQVDKVMEKFGWPTRFLHYLIDVVGIDTGVHGAEVHGQKGFPDRMKPDYKGSIQVMYEKQTSRSKK